MRLLVVEDETDLNEIITKELTIKGYVVDSCFDGQQAYEHLSLSEYDGAMKSLNEQISGICDHSGFFFTW